MQHVPGNRFLPAGALRRSWQAQYGSKMWQARSFGGRFDHDTLHGHQAAVRSLAMLPGSNLLATGVHLPPTHAVWLCCWPWLGYALPPCAAWP